VLIIILGKAYCLYLYTTVLLNRHSLGPKSSLGSVFINNQSEGKTLHLDSRIF